VSSKQRISTQVNPGEELLFAALRAMLGTGAGTNGGSLQDSCIKTALAMAALEQLDALVARGLLALGAPEGTLDLAERSARALRRALLLECDRLALSRAFHEHGIRHVYMKGAFSDALWWGGQGLRGATDLDVLIDPRTAAAATHILHGLGYQRKVVPSHLATQDAMKESSFASCEPGRFPIDLHFGLLNDPPFRDPGAEVLARAMPYQTAAGEIFGLSREDMLVHTGGNLGQKGFMERLKLTLDAACLLLKEPLDTDLVVRRAESWGVSIPLWGLLRLVQERLAVPVPQALLDRVAPPRPLRRWVMHVAGVHHVTRRPYRSGLALLLVDWPLSGRIGWPAQATCRWARLRIADCRRRQRHREPVRATYP
jgi:hypothetical protein